jgi:hypothetical protein
MSKVVLHIGTHKTASTTIQDTFWANADLLAQHGLIYPRIAHETITGHHGLVFDWARLPEGYRLPQGSRQALREIADRHAGGSDTVFLSSEEFSRGDPKATVDFGEVRQLLSDFDEIEVICFLRPQWQFLQSIYMEVSRNRLPVRPPQMVEPVIATGMFEGLWIDYNSLLDQLERHFAPEEITFADFNSCRAVPGGILAYLLWHLEIDLDVAELKLVNGGASNVSPMPLACWMANMLSEPKTAPPWLIAQVTRALEAHFGPDMKPSLFTRPELVRLHKHFEARNALLQQRRSKVQPDFAVVDKDRTGLSVFRNAIPSAFWVRFCRSMVAQRSSNS